MIFIKNLIIIFTLFSSFYCQRPMKPGEDLSRYSVRFRGIECLSMDNSTAYFTFCFVKSYSRTATTINFGINTQKKMKSIFVQLVASFRYGNIYREIVDTKLINWCQVMAGADYNLFMKLILDMIRPSVPGLFHKCPYEGLMEFKNVTMDVEIAKKISIFPEGQYRVNTTIHNGPDKIILALITYSEIKSPIKTSFG
ncbi:hypothetical protein ACKWTF_015524 [Chironomus riparius]